MTHIFYSILYINGLKGQQCRKKREGFNSVYLSSSNFFYQHQTSKKFSLFSHLWIIYQSNTAYLDMLCPCTCYVLFFKPASCFRKFNLALSGTTTTSQSNTAGPLGEILWTASAEMWNCCWDFPSSWPANHVCDSHSSLSLYSSSKREENDIWNGASNTSHQEKKRTETQRQRKKETQINVPLKKTSAGFMALKQTSLLPPTPDPSR